MDVVKMGPGQKERVGLQRGANDTGLYSISVDIVCNVSMVVVFQKSSIKSGRTCFYIQRVLVNVDMQPVGSGPADIL